jgi:hypothetical protein
MGNPATWIELQAELLADAMREDDEDLAARVPAFIGRAESHFQRELFSPEREAQAALTVTNATAALPADFGGAKSVWIDAPIVRVLDRLTPDALRQRYPAQETGMPLHFAIQGETMLFGPVPADGKTIELSYIEGIPPLGESQPTNWVLAAHPDAYVQGALTELYEFTEHFDKAALCRSKRDAILASINRAGRRRRTNSGPLVASAGLLQTSRGARA